MFRAGDRYLDSDAFFGVRSALVTDWVRHAPGRAPTGGRAQGPSTRSSSISSSTPRQETRHELASDSPTHRAGCRRGRSHAASGTAQAPSGPPIRIGSTLALTGPLSATAQIHKIVGEIYIEQANKRGGWLGRPLEWVLKDDQSKPDLARTLYEQLVTVDKVDLLFSPYATPAILSAMGVAQRYNKVLVHHTFGIPSLAKYENSFPAWSLGADPGNTVPATVFDALAAGPSRRRRWPW